MSTTMTMTQVLMGDVDEMRVIELLASRLDRMATWKSLTTCKYLNQSTVFEGPKEASQKKPLDPLLSYLQDFRLEMECCRTCYVEAGIYVERYLRANPWFSISWFNVNRLVLAGLVLSIRIDKPYMRMQRFADAGNVHVDEILDLEEALLGGIDEDSYNIDAAAFEEYCTLLLREEAKPKTPPALMAPTSAPPSSHSAAFQSTLRTQTPPPTSSSSTNTTTTPPPLPPHLALKLPGCICNRGCCHCMHGKFPCSFCNHGESSKQ